MKREGILVVVSGFSGAGKGTVMKELVRRYDCYALSVSATTRGPRAGEVEGIDYFYKTEEQFRAMIEQGELVEYARYVDHFYGTPKAYVEEQLAAGKDVILEIEIQGALKIKKQFRIRFFCLSPRPVRRSWCAGSPTAVPRIMRRSLPDCSGPVKRQRASTVTIIW